MNVGLANPVWAALTSSHQHLAEVSGNVLRYPGDIAPFGSVEHPGVPVATEGLSDAASDVYFVGVLPELNGQGFQISRSTVLQMTGPKQTRHPGPAALPEEVDLTVEDSVDMLELTQVAFPGFFRPRTAQLGRYIGIRTDGPLVAMAGERMRLPGLREISAVCTRPGYTGQGYAKHLMQRLMHSPDQEQVFLHVRASNTRAVQIYRALGFEVCSTVDILRVSLSV